MPFDLTSPDTADFGVAFVDNLTGITYTPATAWVTLNYYIAGTLNSSTVTLTYQDGRWEMSWSSVGVDVPSDVTWSVFSSCSLSPAQIGTIRIIDP